MNLVAKGGEETAPLDQIYSVRGYPPSPGRDAAVHKLPKVSFLQPLLSVGEKIKHTSMSARVFSWALNNNNNYRKTKKLCNSIVRKPKKKMTQPWQMDPVTTNYKRSLQKWTESSFRNFKVAKL